MPGINRVSKGGWESGNGDGGELAEIIPTGSVLSDPTLLHNMLLSNLGVKLYNFSPGVPDSPILCRIELSVAKSFTVVKWLPIAHCALYGSSVSLKAYC